MSIIKYIICDKFDCLSSHIITYSDKATIKAEVDQNAHTIVYIEIIFSTKFDEKTNMNKDLIRIIFDDFIDRFVATFKINLNKLVSIDHNQRIKPLGMVDPRDLPKLLHYVENCARE